MTAAYFTQATVNELRKVDEVLPSTMSAVPDGWFRSARSGKQRQGARANRPIQFANSFGPDTADSPLTMDKEDNQMQGIAGPSGLSPSTQFGPGLHYDIQPLEQQQNYSTQGAPQYSPFRGQETYEMRSSQPPPPPYNVGPFAQPLTHLSLPPPPALPSYKPTSPLNSHAPGSDSMRERHMELDEARGRQGEYQLQQQYRQEERQTVHAQDDRSITIVAPMAYERTPARPLPSIATLTSSPTRGHPYANGLPSRTQNLVSGSGQPGKPSEYYEPPNTVKTIPVSVSPSFGAGLRAGNEPGSIVASGGVYRIPHTHSRHRSSPLQLAPHHLPLPPSPPAPMSHLGAGDFEPSASDRTSVPRSNFASVSPSASTSASASSVPTITVAPSASRLMDLSQLEVDASVNAGVTRVKERVLVPLGDLRTAVYRRRDPTDDALLRRFKGLRTTPPANIMEE